MAECVSQILLQTAEKHLSVLMLPVGLTRPISDNISIQNPETAPVLAVSGKFLSADGRYCMEQQQIMDELNYHRAQKITETLYRSGLISFDEHDKLTQKNRRSFSPLYVDLLPKTLDISTKQS